MEIRTKSNVGDKVYPIHIPLGKEIFMVMDKIEIKAITVVIDKNGIEIDYDFQWVKGLKYFNNHCFEQECFATKEEAQKECDKRNGKENDRCKRKICV